MYHFVPFGIYILSVFLNRGQIKLNETNMLHCFNLHLLQPCTLQSSFNFQNETFP